MSGTFTLNFSSAVNILVLDNFVARWNATGANASGSNSGGLTAIVAVPEPTTWSLMAAGFGLVGVAARRRRRIVLRAA